MGEEETRKYPKGFRFDPFDEELINDYLKPMIMGKLSCDFIELRQVYGDGPSSNPWIVFPNDDQSWFFSPHLRDTEKCMYVFSKLSKISSTSSKRAGSKKAENTKKKAGCGTWDGKTPRKQIRDGGGNVIGDKRYLVFEINEVDSGVSGFDGREVGFFKMHEYSLSGINAGEDSAHSIVLCKITYDYAKACPINLKSGNKNAGNVTKRISEEHEKEETINKNLEEGTSGVTAETKNQNCPINLKSGNKNAGNVTKRISEEHEKEETINKNLEEGTSGVTAETKNQNCPINLSCEAHEKEVITNKSLEATSNVTAENLNVIHGGVDDRSLATELQELDAFCWDIGFDDLGSESFYLGDLDDIGLSFDGLGDLGDVGPCFDVDHILGCLDSDPQEGPIEDNSISNLGKRKFDVEESSCRNKKTCL